MPINQISTANTFQQWLIATQQLINSHNYYEEDFTQLSDNSNLVYELANTTSNLYIATSDTYNTIVAYVNTAYDTANAVYDIANLALETANSISYDTFNLVSQTVSTNTHYILLANTGTGIPTKIFTSTLKFYPSNNTIELTNVNVSGALKQGTNNVLTTANVGVTVQAYDADIAKYDDETANFTGTLQKSGSKVITEADIGVNHAANTTAHGISSFGASLVNDDNANTARNTLELGTTNSPQFAGIQLGHATDTTISRVSGGVAAIEGDSIATANNTLTLTNKTLTSPTIINGYKEEIGTSVPTKINPDNGSIQIFTLTDNLNWTGDDELEDGESILLMVADGTSTYAITWPTMTWVNGTAPILDTTKYTCIELWKVSSTLYGTLVGVV
jgi:hypothetical protein